MFVTGEQKVLQSVAMQLMKMQRRVFPQPVKSRPLIDQFWLRLFKCRDLSLDTFASRKCRCLKMTKRKPGYGEWR
jgi:hypothetical protein